MNKWKDCDNWGNDETIEGDNKGNVWAVNRYGERRLIHSASTYGAYPSPSKKSASPKKEVITSENNVLLMLM